MLNLLSIIVNIAETPHIDFVARLELKHAGKYTVTRLFNTLAGRFIHGVQC